MYSGAHAIGSLMLPSELPTVASFYSGAGGLDLGFTRAGFKIRFANDIDPVAIATHSKYGGAEYAVAADVDSLDLTPALGSDLVIGGPPCQGFSVAGRMNPEDPRSRHVWTFLELVSKIKPKVFVMENVKNLYSSPRWSEIRNGLIIAAGEMGYSTRLMLLNAADFGTPQSRERMFLIGVLGQVEIPELVPPKVVKKISVREALAALPPYGESGNNTFCTAKITTASNPILRLSPYAGMLFNGAGRPLDLDRPSTTLPASMGGNRTPIIEQNLLQGDSRSWISEYHSNLQAGGAPIPSGERPNWSLRRLTVEEASVLQGFPLGMKFSGSVSAQYRQIGNSVAPPLAEAVAKFVKPLVSLADQEIKVPEFSAEELIGLGTKRI